MPNDPVTPPVKKPPFPPATQDAESVNEGSDQTDTEANEADENA